MDGVLVDFLAGVMKELRINREPYQDEIRFYPQHMEVQKSFGVHYLG